VQNTFSKNYVSQSVCLHDTTGRLCSDKCYLRSFQHFSFSTSAPNSIVMSTATQQNFLSSTQPEPVVSNVLISVCSYPSSETLTPSAYSPLICCQTSLTQCRSLIFDLSSLTTTLLAGEFSSSCALSLSSFLARFYPEDTLLHWFQRSTFK